MRTIGEQMAYPEGYPDDRQPDSDPRHRFTKASRYIDSLRHAAKRKYAREYYQWIRSGFRPDQEADYSPDSLSFMAAQAVRMNLAEIMAEDFAAHDAKTATP
jgi:hypothetical protein